MDFKSGIDNLERMLLDARAEPTDLPLSVLKEITNNFSDDHQVGRGGFAIVYKGQLRNGIVAVKKLNQTLEMDDKKFNQEVACLMRVRHKNIVRFLGYCADTQGKLCDYDGEVVMADIRERLLCFEFLPKGSLDRYITDEYTRLEWSTRYKLIKGICEGLHYLHQKNIAHLDLKPANILLDHSMVPKIADFGLSRCFPEEQSKIIASKLIGSQGYVAPEFYDKVITLKLDIYSLGVMIIEILTGKKGYFQIENVLKSWSNRLKPSQADKQLEQVRVCCEIGLKCIDSNPVNRPTTNCVIETLGDMETRCSSVGTDICTSPVITHVLECYGTSNPQRPITLGKIDSLDTIEFTHGFIGPDERTSTATHVKKGSMELQNPKPKTSSSLLDVHLRPRELSYPLELNNIHGHGPYQSSTDVEQTNTQFSLDVKCEPKYAGAKDQKKVGDHKKLTMIPMAMPLIGASGSHKKSGKGDNNEGVEVQIKGIGNDGSKRASSAKQNNNGGGMENAKGVAQGSGGAGPPVAAGGRLLQHVGVSRPYMTSKGDVGFPSEMETRCSSVETDFCTLPVTHGETRLEATEPFEIDVECIDRNLERRPITPGIIDRQDKMERTYGFIGSDRTSPATHENKGSTELQDPTPKTPSSVLDVHPRPWELSYPFEPNNIHGHGPYQSSTDVEQANKEFRGDAKGEPKYAGAKDQKKVGANEVGEAHIKGNGNDGGKRASSAKQDNNGGSVENAKGATQGGGAAGPPVGANGPLGGMPLPPLQKKVGVTRPYMIGGGDVGFPGMGQIGGWPMSMPMDHPRIGKMQQGEGDEGGGDVRGMPAGATPGFKQRGAAGGRSTRSGQEMRAAVLAGNPMARPQYIAPMQNHGGGDGPVNHGGGKIRGGEQLQNTECVAPSGGSGAVPVSASGPLLGGMPPPKSGMMWSNMVGDAGFPGIDQMSAGLMHHSGIGPMQQGGGGGGARGMPAGGTPTAGFQQRGATSGSSTPFRQEMRAAVVAENPMAWPQYIAPMQNHGGGDGHVNHGGGKIRGGEQLQKTKCVTAGGGASAVPVGVSGPLGGMPPPKSDMMRSNMIGDPGFPGIGQMSGWPMQDHVHIFSMQQGGGGGATQGKPAGGRSTPSGMGTVRAAVEAGNPMAQQQQQLIGMVPQQQRGMPLGMEVLQDAVAAGNRMAHQQYMDRMQQQPLPTAGGKRQ